MPKPSSQLLIWSEEHRCYDLHMHGQRQQSFRQQDEPAWLAWVQEHATFAFQGQEGHLSLIKEARPHGSSYWYAYRRQAGHTRKCYLGSSAKVTFAHLEQIARELKSSSSPLPLEPRAILFSGPHSPLLSTKLTPPRPPAWLVERSHLLRELAAVRSYPLTLISASAGSGKTTLLSAWVTAQGMEESRGKAFAWLSLDALDREPTRFWTAVIAALRTGLPLVGQTAFALLRAQESPPLSAILMHLLNELEQTDVDIILILDDYHVISEQSIHESMSFLLEHLPANLHLVLATRTDPALPLSRLRMHGQLLEFRNWDLRFSQAEAASLLVQGMGLSLTEEEVALLEKRTEGWVAGLQLAALSLRKREDHGAFIKNLAGSHRYLLDYVQQDILAQLPASLRDFLVQTAILPRMNAAICQAVTAEPSLLTSQQTLEELERANLFVTPLDDERQWYRYHDLFRDALQVCLQTSYPERIPLLHQRAASFYEAADELREAIVHALAAADYPSAVRMMEREAPHLWLSGDVQTVYGWIASLPNAVLWQHAPFALNAMLSLLPSLYQATEDSYKRMQARVEQTISQLEVMLHQHKEGGGMPERGRVQERAHLVMIRRRLHLLRAFFETRAILRRGDKKRLAELAQELEEFGQDDEVNWNIISLTIAFWLTESFQYEEALLRKRLLEARQQAQKARDQFARTRLMVYVPLIYMREGALHLVEQECLTELALAQQSGRQLTWAEYLLGYLHLFLAYVYYAWNRLEEATASTRQALRIAQDWQQADLLVLARLLFAQLELCRGNLVAADQAIEQTEMLIQQEHFASRVLLVAAVRAQYWLQAGNLDAANRWARQTVILPEAWDRHPKGALLMQVQVYLALQQYPQALDILESARQRYEYPGDIQQTINFLALYLVALHQAGQCEHAWAVAVRLLTLTEQENYLRVYLDLGEPMKQALKMLLLASSDEPEAAASGSFSRSYVLRLLAAFEQEASSARPLPARMRPSVPPLLEAQEQEAQQLSPQELKVLRLLEAGQSYTQVAEVLVVSLNTIKTQVSSIYRKLGVNRRTQAITVARQLHWL